MRNPATPFLAAVVVLAAAISFVTISVGLQEAEEPTGAILGGREVSEETVGDLQATTSSSTSTSIVVTPQQLSARPIPTQRTAQEAVSTTEAPVSTTEAPESTTTAPSSTTPPSTAPPTTTAPSTSLETTVSTVATTEAPTTSVATTEAPTTTMAPTTAPQTTLPTTVAEESTTTFFPYVTTIPTRLTTTDYTTTNPNGP